MFEFFKEDAAGFGEQAVFLPDDNGAEREGWLERDEL